MPKPFCRWGLSRDPADGPPELPPLGPEVTGDTDGAGGGGAAEVPPPIGLPPGIPKLEAVAPPPISPAPGPDGMSAPPEGTTVGGVPTLCEPPGGPGFMGSCAIFSSSEKNPMSDFWMVTVQNSTYVPVTTGHWLLSAVKQLRSYRTSHGRSHGQRE